MKIWASNDLIGGAAGALDAIDGSALSDGDACLVYIPTGQIYFYILNATSGVAESSPDIIAPDTNPGTKRWVLKNVYNRPTSRSEVYSATSLIGGGAGALDNIDGADLADGDIAFVSTVGNIYIYHLDDDSAAAESSPDVISPDTNAGNKRWLIVDIYGAATTVPLIVYF